MQLGRLASFFNGACCTATRLGTRRRLQCVAGVLVSVWWIGPSAPAQAADIEDLAAVPSLPWSALPTTAEEHSHPLYLVVPRLPIAVQSDPSLNALSDEGTTTAVGTTLWSSDYGDARLGISIGEVEDDHPIGENRKRYTAIFAFDQPLGFSTALSVDVLSKDKRRGPKQFRLLQIGISHPVETGTLAAGTSVVLNGFKPELNFGIRFFIPFGGP
jgi:hypothetical protein